MNSCLLLVAISMAFAISLGGAGAELPSSSSSSLRGKSRAPRGGPTCSEATTGHCLFGPRSCGPESCCRGCCVDLKSDIFNCGGCGRLCAYFHGCCAGVCKDLMRDTLNCGACGNVCPEGGPCNFGRCSHA